MFMLFLVAAMETLVDRIDILVRALPKTIGTAPKKSRIAHVIQTVHGENNDTPTTFNRRLDVLFGEDLRDDQGRLPNILREVTGLPLFV
jgi:hypothetical protein